MMENAKEIQFQVYRSCGGVQAVLEQLVPSALLLLILGIDYAMILAGIKLAYWLRLEVIPLTHDGFGVPWIYRDVIIPVAFLVCLHLEWRDILQMYFWQQAEKVFKACSFAVVAVVAIMYFGGIAGEISRLFILLIWLFCFVFLVSGRYIFKKIVVRINCLKKPVIILGAGKTADILLKSFPHHLGTGYRIIGFIEDNLQENKVGGKYPILGRFAQAEKIVASNRVRNVLIAAPGLERKRLLDLVYRLQPYVDNITFIPDLFGMPITGMEVETLFNEKTILLRITNNLAKRQNRLVKWLFDRVLSLLGVVFFIPLFILIAAAIYIESPGAILFAHERIGKDGRAFPCYKFRTMVKDSQESLRRYLDNNPAAKLEWERDFKLKNDPRVTRCGRFLRKTSLDELPQFLNVLKGEMSLVGPRPIVQEEVCKYEGKINDYYMVRPGITGVWQVSGRNDVDYSERVQMDSWYVRNWSLWLDIILLVRTIGVVLRRRGAY